MLYCVHSFAQVEIETGFEGYPDETDWTHSTWTTEGFTVPWTNGFNDSRCQVDHDEFYSGSSSLRVSYPSGGVGPGQSGAQAPLEVTPRNEYYASYYVRFSENFDWGGSNEGGKLPGLSGGNRCSGCSNCTGSNGFTARLMWRPSGRLVLYLYHMDKRAANDPCGDDDNLLDVNDNPIYANKGEWYHIIQRVKVNTGSNYDGEVEVWVNGEHALTRTGIRFVTNGDQVDALYFSTFHGGSGSSWAPSVDCNIWFDDIKIGQSYTDVAGVQCSTPDLGEDQSLCGVSSINLDANVITTNKTFTWYKDGAPFSGSSSTNTVTEAGTYSVEVDSAGCVTTDDIVISNTLSADLGADQTLCETTSITLSIGSTNPNYTYSWTKNGAAINGATSASLSVQEEGTYEINVSAAGCAAVSDNIVISSDLLDGNNDTICSAGTANLSVGGSGTYEWYTSEVGGSLLHSGESYSPSVAINTTYYVEDVSSVPEIFGLSNQSGTVWSTTNFADTDKHSKVTVYETVTLNAVSVYVTNNNTNVVVNLSDETGATVIQTASANNLSSGKHRIDLNFDIDPGTYVLGLVGTNNQIGFQASGASFPYSNSSSPTKIQFENNEAWASSWYGFFYDWEIDGGSACTRTPVHAIIDNSHSSCGCPDTDGDGTDDCSDQCINDPNKIVPGDCGCGIPEGTCEDCNGDPNGTASVDACGVCSGGNTGITPNSTCADCNGDPNGTASVDACGVCSGGNTGVTPNSTCADCNGDPNGTASVDACGVCSGGNTEVTPNSTCADCNGDPNGTASVDACGVCSGGNTGVTPNSTCADCNGDPNGTASVDACGVCSGGNTGVTPNSTCADCNGDPNGTASVDACGVCSGGNTGVTPNSTCADCNGDPNGTASVDACGVCSGGNTGVTPNSTCADCNGDPNGTASVDACGVCSGGNTGVTPNSTCADCNGDPNGTASVDACGVCSGGSTGITPNSTCADCNGDPNGTASVDACGVCSGGNTGVTPNSTCVDCNGDPNGTASVDACGVCSGGNTGVTPNSTCVDCNGDPNGTASVDACGVCSGGNTGVTPNSTCADCNGDPNGTASVDACGVCSGGNTGVTPNSTCADCNGDPNGTASVDACGVCSGGNTGVTPNSSCTDCNGDVNGTAFVDGCSQCVGGNTGEVPCDEDCHGDLGGTASVDQCGVCSGGNTGVTPNSTCLDCNDDINGSATIDVCGVCSGGNTGIGPNSTCADCNGDPNGTAAIDNCSVCSGGNTGVPVDACLTSLEDANELNEVRLYPNPFVASLSFEIDASRLYLVKIYNPMGVLIEQQEFVGQSVRTINIDGARGVYFIYVISGDQSRIFKVIKE